MANLHLLTVRTPRDLERFLDVAERLAIRTPDSVAPWRMLRRRRLAAHKPFDQAGHLKLIVALRDTEPVGAIAVHKDKDWDAHKDGGIAFFGYFEAEDQADTIAALVHSAEATAREWGATLLRGPRDLSRVDPRGTVVEGHGPPPFLANNPYPWLAEALERLGYRKHHDAYAYDTSLRDPQGNPRQLPPKLLEQARGVNLPGLSIRSAAYKTLRHDLDAAHHIYVEAFRSVPDNTPMPRAQFMAFGALLLSFTDPKLVQIAWVNGAPAGFAVCFPEINEAVVAARGHLLPLGAARLLRQGKSMRTASFKLFGVLPEYRGTGLHALLIEHALSGVLAAGYTRLEASLIDERNAPMRAIVEGAGMAPYRIWRVFERDI